MPGAQKLSAIRSMPSRSSFARKSAAMSEYPGRKRTSRRPSSTRTGVSLSRGASTKRMHASVRRIMSARSPGMRFGAVCGMFIYLPSSSIGISAGVGGAYWFIASIRDHPPRPRQIRGLPDAPGTQVQAAARHSPGRRCLWFYLLSYDPFKTPLTFSLIHHFEVYPTSII